MKLTKAHPTSVAAGAAWIMTRHRVHRLLVLEHQSLVGMLSSMDVLRAVGQGALS